MVDNSVLGIMNTQKKISTLFNIIHISEIMQYIQLYLYILYWLLRLSITHTPRTNLRPAHMQTGVLQAHRHTVWEDVFFNWEPYMWNHKIKYLKKDQCAKKNGGASLLKFSGSNIIGKKVIITVFNSIITVWQRVTLEKQLPSYVRLSEIFASLGIMEAQLWPTLLKLCFISNKK